MSDASDFAFLKCFELHKKLELIVLWTNSRTSQTFDVQIIIANRLLKRMRNLQIYSLHVIYL